MPDTITPTGPIAGPDCLVVGIGGNAEAALDVSLWPDTRNADLAAAGQPARYYIQPPRVTLAQRQSTPDLDFSATVMVQAPPGPQPAYLGGSCTFTCTLALPDGADADIADIIAGHRFPDPPARIASLFPHADGAPAPELRMMPVTGSAVSCVVEHPQTGADPLVMTVQHAGGGSIEAQGRNTFLVSLSPAAARELTTRLRDESTPPFEVRNVLTERFDTGPTTFTVDLECDLHRIYQESAAIVPPGHPWTAASTDAAYHEALATGALRTAAQDSTGALLNPELLTWLQETSELKEAAVNALKEHLFDTAATTDGNAPGSPGTPGPSPAWWADVFGDSAVTLKPQPAESDTHLHQRLTLHGAITVDQTVQGDLSELAAAAKNRLATYLTVVAV